MVAVPGPRAGALIVGESVIAYLHESQPMRCTPIKQTNVTVRACCLVYVPAPPMAAVRYCTWQLEEHKVVEQIASTAIVEPIKGQTNSHSNDTRPLPLAYAHTPLHCTQHPHTHNACLHRCPRLI